MPKEVPKFGVHEVIQFVGVNELSPEEQTLVSSLSTDHYNKIKRELHNITSLVVHVKTYEKEGHRKKFSLHVRCIAPTRIFESCKSHDWDLARALHKAFEDIRREIGHALHNDTSRKKGYE